MLRKFVLIMLASGLTVGVAEMERGLARVRVSLSGSWVLYPPASTSPRLTEMRYTVSKKWVSTVVLQL